MDRVRKTGLTDKAIKRRHMQTVLKILLFWRLLAEMHDLMISIFRGATNSETGCVSVWYSGTVRLHAFSTQLTEDDYRIDFFSAIFSLLYACSHTLNF